MNTVNMVRLSRCAIFLTSPLDGEALAGATGLEPAPSCVTGRGAVVSAGAPLRVAPLLQQMFHRPSPARRAYQFFRLRSFSASMSMACCATLFFSRAFSFSNSFIRAISGPFIPP